MKNNRYFDREAVSPHITRVRGLIGEYMYLIQGETRVLLIDTGCGAGNLEQYIRSVTHLPVTVVLSHGHYDHAGGAGRFREVYIAKEEWIAPSLRYCPEQVIGELKSRGICPPFSDMTENKMPDTQDLSDGKIFDLGGISVEAIAFPGHTPGSFCFLIPEDRILFAGDACHRVMYLFFPESLSVYSYKKNLEKILRRRKEWDRILLSHSVGEAPGHMIEEMQKVSCRILEGKAQQIPFSFRHIPGWIAEPVDKNMERIDGKWGNIIYDKDKIR